MKKSMIAAVITLLAVLALGGTASAQAPAPNCPVDNPVFYDPDGVCPNDVVRPPDDGGTAAPSGTLPRTGANDSLPLAKMAIVLIGVGGALTIIAARKRAHAVSA